MEILVAGAASDGLSLFPHVVIYNIFNSYFSVKCNSIPSSAAPPVGQATGISSLFLRLVLSSAWLLPAPTPCFLGSLFSLFPTFTMMFSLLALEYWCPGTGSPCNQLNEPRSRGTCLLFKLSQESKLTQEACSLYYVTSF